MVGHGLLGSLSLRSLSASGTCMQFLEPAAAHVRPVCCLVSQTMISDHDIHVDHVDLIQSSRQGSSVSRVLLISSSRLLHFILDDLELIISPSHRLYVNAVTPYYT